MIIKCMEASFGGLENAHMELEPGLNIVEAPNEAGKSTWCGFIRTMLYGINTSQREKAGLLPDKKRFLPWGSYPMTGAMRIEWRGGDVTLSRSGAAGKPMGACDAKVSGTAQKVPELCGKAPGEIILGVPESVFRRSAFISSGSLAVDKDAELEKRISALITSGSEEDESYSTARAALHGWRVKLKHNARVGRAAQLEGEISEKNAALAAIREENTRLGDIYTQRTAVSERVVELETRLRLHDAAKLKAEYDKIAAAKAARNAAAAELEQLKSEAGDLSTEKLNAARLAVSEYREAAANMKAVGESTKRHNEAKDACRQAENELLRAQRESMGVTPEGITTARRALYEYENVRAGAAQAQRELERFGGLRGEASDVKKIPAGLETVAVILMILGLAGCAVYFAAAALTAIMVTAVVLLVVGVALAIVCVLRKNAATEAGEAKRAELAVYENLAKDAESKLEEAQRELVAALAAIGGETIPERAESRIGEREKILEQREQARTKLETAEKIAKSLEPAPGTVEAAADREDAAARKLSATLAELGIDPEGNIVEGIEEKSGLLARLQRAEADHAAAVRLVESLGELPELPEGAEKLTAPEGDREAIQAELENARLRAAELERALALSEGELRHLGDPLVVATELENLKAAHAANEEECEALSLAMSVLDEANAELQQRFSPIVGDLAGRLMAAMTDGAYDKVSFDREFNFTAARAGEAEHGAEYLSTGTSAQLYLAVRLAICMLALSEEESCPIILDDALLGFDDKRAKAALELLQELSKERQIILFTCQSREKLLLDA